MPTAPASIARLRRAGRALTATAASILEHIGREPDGPRAVAVASRPAARASPAAPHPHDGGRRAPGLRSVRRTRPPDAGRRRQHRASARAAPARLRLRQRARCTASSIRFSACRATTSPCSSPAKAARARSWSRARFTSALRAARRCSCPTTARRRRGSSPTASCSAIVAARSPAPCPINRGWCARPRAARCSSTKSATCRSTCSPSCCGFSSRARSCRSAKRGRSASTCASSPPPTPISSSAWPRASSAKICITG